MTLPDVPTAQSCRLGSLSEDVIASPVQENYHIGQTVTLSCPEGKQLNGVEEVSCNPSQEFSPDPANVRCVTGGYAKSVVTPTSPSDALNALFYPALHLYLISSHSGTTGGPPRGAVQTVGEVCQGKMCLQNAFRVQVLLRMVVLGGVTETPPSLIAAHLCLSQQIVFEAVRHLRYDCQARAFKRVPDARAKLHGQELQHHRGLGLRVARTYQHHRLHRLPHVGVLRR